LEAERVGLRELEAALSRRQEALYELENKIQLIEQDRRYKLQEQEGLRRTAEHSRAEREAVERGLANLERELTEVREQRAALGDQGGEQGLEAQAGQLRDEFEQITASLRSEREQLDRRRQERARAQQRTATLEATILSRVESVGELRERIETMASEAGELEQSTDLDPSRLESARAGLLAAEQLRDSVRERRSALDRERVELRERLRSAEVEVETARKELLRARSRLQSLEEIQSRYQACQSGVQVVMQHRERLAEVGAQLSMAAGLHQGSHAVHGVHGIMADFISAPAHLESAVSAVLGDRLQGVVVDATVTGASGVELLKELKEGRTTFLPVLSSARASRREPHAFEEREGASSWRPPERGVEGAIEVIDLVGGASDMADTGEVGELADPDDLELSGREAELPAPFEALVMEGRGPDPLAGLRGVEGVLGRLSELVDVEPQLRELVDLLLGETVVVDRLARALELWHRARLDQTSGAPGRGKTFVTLDGDRIEPTGVVVGGSSDAIDSALLQQKREIGELATIVTGLEADLGVATQRRQGLAERLDEVERGREASELEALEAEKARVGAAQEVSAIEQARTRLSRQLEQLVRGRADLQATLEHRESERFDLEEQLAQLREDLPTLEDDELLTDRVDALGEAREQIGARLTEVKVALASWQEQRNAMAATAERLTKQVASERERSRRLGEAADASDARIVALGSEIEAMVDEHAALLDVHRVQTSAKHDAAEAHDAALVSVEELELSLRRLRHEFEDQRERLQEVELGLRELALERGHLETDIRDRFDTELRTMLVDFHDRILMTEVERERIRELKRVIARMGEVNLTAIAEYEEVSGRYEYLTGQRKDLEDAIAQLREAIDRIDATTKERFAETFHAVNEMFQRLFPRLFSGGQAKLVLTDPNNLLETGVEILAQPPGKKISSLELLSGGEKALTAVSLIFGIFLIKASPFCLLDEVDAPLDEANVARFCDLVRELSEGTQFIIITHNKRTMEIADRLYGVTMQQRGVSKLVSVNMRRAVSQVLTS
jgi:chromosome segregation protein